MTHKCDPKGATNTWQRVARSKMSKRDRAEDKAAADDRAENKAAAEQRA